MENNKKQRRNFLKGALALLAGIGLVKFSQRGCRKTENKKIKMLTPDGKLVEVDESVISKLASVEQRASNEEVQKWMNTAKT